MFVRPRIAITRRAAVIGGLACMAPFLLGVAVANRPVRARADWTQIVVPTPQGGMRMGNPAARVKLIEFGSRVCSHCARFAREGLPALKLDYVASGQVSYEFRDFPVAGAVDLGPILLGRCVPASRYFPVLERMFADQDALLANVDIVAAAIKPGASPNQVARDYAEGLGYLDLMQRAGFQRARMLACLGDHRGIYRIASETRVAAQSHQVRSTPTFEINGKTVAGVSDWEGLRPALDTALR